MRYGIRNPDIVREKLSADSSAIKDCIQVFAYLAMEMNCDLNFIFAGNLVSLESIEKAKKSRCSKNVNLRRLPVIHLSVESSWMDTVT